LLACGKDQLADLLLASEKEYSNNVHNMFLDELRIYFFTGGMPECVKIFAERMKLKEVFDIQKQLIETYRADFSKYAPYADRRCLNSVLTNTAKMVGQQIKYARLTTDFTPPTNKKAFDLLSMARVIYKIPSTSPAGLPLGASASSKRFKALMVDIGLMQNLCDVNISEEIFKLDLLDIYRGALAEQFVGQELLAGDQSEIYYWSREAKSSTAEVDFIFEYKGKILPVEVKSGASGKLKSMHLLLKTYPSISAGYVFSTRTYSEIPEQKLYFHPIYEASQLAKV
jgi:predicted AAA+ superfamily ATPase